MPRHRWSTQDPDLQGPRNATSGGLNILQQRPRRLLGLAGRRRDLRKTEDDIHDDCHTRRHAHSVLPTVFDHYTPAIRGKMTTSTFPCACTPSLLVSIKGGGGLPLRGDVRDISDHGHPHSRSSSPLSTTELSPQPTPLLVETWELPSLSRLACTPNYKHSGCKIIQCPRTPPLLDVRPRGRNQDKLVRYCVASCINIWDEKIRGIY